MICLKCGADNNDTAKFCSSCGEKLIQSPPPQQPEMSSQSFQPRSDLYAPPAYSSGAHKQSAGKPMGFNTTPEEYFSPPPGYVYSKRNPYSPRKFNTFQLIALVMLFVTFIGMFTPWLKARIEMDFVSKYDEDDSYSDSEKKSKTFWGLFGNKKDDEDEDDDTFSKMASKIEEDHEDKINFRENLMKWFGLAGFLLAFAAILIAFFKPRLMAVAAVLSAGCFIAVLIAAVSWLSVRNDFKDEIIALIKSYFKTYSIKINELSVKYSYGFGMILSLTSSAAAAVMAVIGAFIPKKDPEQTSAQFPVQY